MDKRIFLVYYKQIGSNATRTGWQEGAIVSPQTSAKRTSRYVDLRAAEIVTVV
jgi:hypothetical protein